MSQKLPKPRNKTKISEWLVTRFIAFSVMHLLLAIEVIWSIVGISGRWIVSFEICLLVFPPLFFLETILEIRSLEEKNSE